MFVKQLLFPLLFGVATKGDSKDEPRSPCDDLVKQFPRDAVQGINIISVNAEEKYNYSTIGGFPGYQSVKVDDFCQVKITYNHVGSDDKVNTEIWLPFRPHWNGRYQATGGGGFATGIFDTLLGPAVNNGYAASSTDGGHDRKDLTGLSWALKEDKTVDMDLLQTAFTRSLVEQIVLSKKVIEQFYGEKAHHSYWFGCSQGGRQGYMIAQRYPRLLDGILASAPAISFTHLVMGDFWPQLVMKEEGYWMSQCELDFFREKAIDACDLLDGVRDGVISDPEVCDFDPLHVIGKTFHCDGKDVEVTTAMAEIVRKIEQGPQTPFKKSIWHGFTTSTNLNAVAGTATSQEGVRLSAPFPIASNFIGILLLQDPSFNVTKLSYSDFMALYAQASYSYGSLLDSDNPNLDAFKAAGGKLLTWHGVTDSLIPYKNTVRYRKLVEQLMGGANEVDQFYRLFLAPGVDHCSGGVGPVPVDPLSALVDWVEKNEPPEVLDARTTNSEGEVVSRDLCAWPGKAKYMGLGDAKRGSSWSCVGGTERPEVEFESAGIGSGSQVPLAEQKKKSDRTGDILGGLKDRLEGLGMGLTIG
ncbi:tannase-domain-containing protein [Massarina eburnea CBS 473.64]|uniref:Carboxylic ester hydrolase n=1 Tax=Massarina eburnea CBS 473.64 TaxID=1395130 RepID=A0A6A6RK87_9PLEO|nr:tannase-domain-containing protein [Massarina eburnea CBS 473.64]